MKNQQIMILNLQCKEILSNKIKGLFGENSHTLLYSFAVADHAKFAERKMLIDQMKKTRTFNYGRRRRRDTRWKNGKIAELCN